MVKHVVGISKQSEAHATLSDLEVLEDGEIRVDVVGPAVEVACPIAEVSLSKSTPESGSSEAWRVRDCAGRKSTRLNSSHQIISSALFSLKTKTYRLHLRTDD